MAVLVSVRPEDCSFVATLLGRANMGIGSFGHIRRRCDTCGHLLERSGGCFQRGGLILGTMRQTAGGSGNLADII